MEERYEPLKELGAGNFGVARLAKDKKTGELVAVKYIERGKKVNLLLPKIFSCSEIQLINDHLLMLLFVQIFLCIDYSIRIWKLSIILYSSPYLWYDASAWAMFFLSFFCVLSKYCIKYSMFHNFNMKSRYYTNYWILETV